MCFPIRTFFVPFANSPQNDDALLARLCFRVHGFLHVLDYDHELGPEASQYMEEEDGCILRKLRWKGEGLINVVAVEDGLPHLISGKLVVQCLQYCPHVNLSANTSPITPTVLQDSENEHIYCSELSIMTKEMVAEGSQMLTFTIPIFEPLPSRYYIRAVSDTYKPNLFLLSLSSILSYLRMVFGWYGEQQHPPPTEFLDLRPLPVAALGNKEYELLYSFTHFHPIQTQVYRIILGTHNPGMLDHEF